MVVSEQDCVAQLWCGAGGAPDGGFGHDGGSSPGADVITAVSSRYEGAGQAAVLGTRHQGECQSCLSRRSYRIADTPPCFHYVGNMIIYY